jgi:hypothetical protein
MIWVSVHRGIRVQWFASLSVIRRFRLFQSGQESLIIAKSIHTESKSFDMLFYKPSSTHPKKILTNQ